MAGAHIHTWTHMNTYWKLTYHKMILRVPHRFSYYPPHFENTGGKPLNSLHITPPIGHDSMI